MKYEQVPMDTFKTLVLGAGVLASEFDPTSGELDPEDIKAATDGGASFKSNPTYKDYAEGIDNLRSNTKEFKRLDSCDPVLSGKYKSVTAELASELCGGAEVSGSTVKKIVPRPLTLQDFKDIWWVGDYSDVNDDGTSNKKAGYMAIHLMNALNTSGFGMDSANQDKSSIDFEYHGHYSIQKPHDIPFEIYICPGVEGT